jgi:hypothetical protein
LKDVFVIAVFISVISIKNMYLEFQLLGGLICAGIFPLFFRGSFFELLVVKALKKLKFSLN